MHTLINYSLSPPNCSPASAPSKVLQETQKAQMIPRTAPRIPTQDPNPSPSPTPAYVEPSTPSSTSPSMILVAFLILLAALFSICLFSAAARRLFSLLSHGRHHQHPSHPPPPPRRSRTPFPGAATRGMDPATVRSLPMLTYVGPSGSGSPTPAAAECCAVCLGELEAKEQVKVIPRCGHVFHPACIDRWLIARGSCPVCRCASDMMVPSSGVTRCGCGGEVDEERAEHVPGERTRE